MSDQMGHASLRHSVHNTYNFPLFIIHFGKIGCWTLLQAITYRSIFFFFFYMSGKFNVGVVLVQFSPLTEFSTQGHEITLQ